MTPTDPRVAAPDDAATVAALLHDFNREFDTPTPGVAVLSARLSRLLASDDLLAVLAGEPAHAVAVVSLRPNPWFDGPVALLDELYVAPELRRRGIGTTLLESARSAARLRGAELMEINVDSRDVDARRFYERNGFSGVDPDTGEPALYYSAQC